jgi:hypothetical protein
MVVLSPPGMMRPAKPSSCSGFLTSIASTPSFRKHAMCSLNEPCKAKTPTAISLSLSLSLCIVRLCMSLTLLLLSPCSAKMRSLKFRASPTSGGAEYVTFQKCFLKSKFPTPPIKLKLGLQLGGRLRAAPWATQMKAKNSSCTHRP